MGDEEKCAIAIKVVLIGETGVGKTSIISRYIQNNFSPVLMSTTGASFATKSIYLEEQKQSIKFEIWDTAGQERYRSLAKVFYKNASICILVYDITRKTSFDELKKYWINEIKQNASQNIILALAGNKDDKYEHQEVSENEAKMFAKEINAIFQKTSAKQSRGVDELFKLIAQKYIDPNTENLTNLTNDELKKRGQKLKVNGSDTNEQSKKKCCGN